MARINLLPWRAERRKQREREFFAHLGLAAVGGVVLVVIWAMWMNMRISNQNQRNAMLKTQIHQLDERIAQIKDLEKVRDHLLARKRIIEKLQADRSKMVHLFDELVKTIPPSVRLTSVEQKGDSIKIKGVAQSNASVADYMRNLEASPWMTEVQLGRIDNKHGDSRTPYVFDLSMKMSKPKSDDEQDNAGMGMSAGGKTAKGGRKQ